MEKSRTFSIFKIIDKDYYFGFLLWGFILSSMFYTLTNSFGYMVSWSGLVAATEFDIQFFRKAIIVVTIVGTPYLTWKLYIFHILYKRGVEVTGTINWACVYSRGGRIEYKYTFQNEEYLRGNAVSWSTFRKHRYT